MSVSSEQIEVWRKAHELSASHGWKAHVYAAKMAARALAEGDSKEHAFWKSVEAALTPGTSN
jgi:hypothetical protein